MLDTLANGKLKLAEVKKEQLPAEWQKLNDAELKAEVDKKQKERTELQAQITKLNQDRDNYLAAERRKLAASGKADSFDEQVANAIRVQAARKGMRFSSN